MTSRPGPWPAFGVAVTRDGQALTAYLDRHFATPFDWAGDDGHDCARFADGAVQVQTGRSPLAELGVDWSTRRGAYRVLRRLGGIEAAVGRVLWRRPIVAHAVRGDVALVSHAAGVVLAVVEGRTLAAPAEQGLVRLPRTMAEVVWSPVPIADGVS